MKQRILFVCLGNICRSPAAEEIMRRMLAEAGLQEQVEVDSAGTYGGHAGDLPDARMRRAAAMRGYVLRHRARRVTEEDFVAFDRIVAMDDANYEALCRMAPSREAIGRVCRMAEFFGAPHRDSTYVPDPYYAGHEGFESVLDLLVEACANLLAAIRSRNRS